MIYFLYTVHIVVSLFLIMVVLLQQGKGADLSVFGGGGTQAAFGARGAATVLHKLTVGCFVAFIFTTIAIGFMTSSRTGSSVMSTVAEEAAVEVNEAAAPEEMPTIDPESEAAGTMPEGDVTSTPVEDPAVDDVPSPADEEGTP